ncbi:MAG: proline dehydrogenase family protein [Acidobacteria bacterium]|nr:proline dehydrogenase family protein [Acidobacteriota bacterium]MCB9397296.1 proline dehydrogenase family protein [Acidobacteriota bacterium]
MGVLDQFIVKTLPLVPKPIVKRLSKAYIAGAELDQAVSTVKDLNQKGFCTTIDLLGEFVENFDQVAENEQGYRNILKVIQEHQLDANISIKPTSFGLLLDEDQCCRILESLLEEAAKMGNFMRIDMEDSECTTPTIRMYERFRKRFGHHVGVVLQAYLKRTPQDVKEITADQPGHFRLCKGIYVEPEAIAIKSFQGIRDQFVSVLDAMFASGSYVGIATHDDYLVDQAEKLIAQKGLKKDQYEFQMLLGVREALRDQILSRGHKLRIYVPYGQRWYEYSVRRLKENPALAGTMFKAIFFG